MLLLSSTMFTCGYLLYAIDQEIDSVITISKINVRG